MTFKNNKLTISLTLVAVLLLSTSVGISTMKTASAISGPGLSLQVLASPEQVVKGNSVEIYYYVTNTGDVDFDSCTLVSSLGGFIDNFALSIGQQRINQITYGPIFSDTTEIAQVECLYSGGAVAASSSAFIDAINPAVVFDWRINQLKVSSGTEVKYSYTLENQGDVALDCTVTDSIFGEIGSAIINPGDSATFTKTANIIEKTTSTPTVECEYNAFKLVNIGVEKTVDINQPPVAVEDSFETSQEIPVSGNVLANDYDLDGDALTVPITSPPSNGVVSLDENTGDFTYTPNPGFAGTDSFKYKANDGIESSNEAQVTITIVSFEDQINKVVNEVKDLKSSKGIEGSLIKKLQNAINNLTNDDPTDDSEACEKLQSLIDQLNALVNSGKLKESDIEPLVDSTEKIMGNIGCI